MIKRRICCLLLAIISVLGWVNVSATTDTTINNTLECIGLDAQSSFLGNRALISNAEAVILYEKNTDTLMYTYNADARIYPASLVKIMTALLAVEQGRLTDVVLVKKDVLSTIPDSAVSVKLKEGELITLEDLLYCMMVASANDAAVVIADYISGDIATFVALMNERAAEIGCLNTSFTNVHGLHNSNQYSTARDLAKILSVASENESFMKLFSAVYYDVPATNLTGIRYLSTGNYIMNNNDVQIYYDSRVTGGRTGVDTNGGRALATTASANGLDYICIVTGSKSVYEKDGYTVRSFGSYKETKDLLDIGFNGHSRGQVFFKGQSLKQVSVINGENDVVLGANSDVFAIVPNNANLSYRYSLNQELHAPIEEGEILADVEVWCNGVCIAQSQVYAMNSVLVAGTSFHTVLYGTPWYEVLITVIVCILGVMLLAGAGYVVYKKVRTKGFAPKVRRRRKSHTRN